LIARGRGLPVATANSTLTIEATNVSSAPVWIVGVYASFIHTFPFTEIFFGSGTLRIPLSELAGRPQPPCVLGVGESVVWSAELSQLREQSEAGQLVLGPHSRYFDLRTREDFERWMNRGRLAHVARNVVTTWSHRRLAVVLEDDRGGLHKAKVRWEPPEGMPPDARRRVLV
jgi:hypothetical protein